MNDTISYDIKELNNYNTKTTNIHVQQYLAMRIIIQRLDTIITLLQNKENRS